MAHYYPVLKTEAPKIIKALLDTIIRDTKKEVFTELASIATQIRFFMLYDELVQKVWDDITSEDTSEDIMNVVLAGTSQLIMALDSEGITLDKAFTDLAKAYVSPIKGATTEAQVKSKVSDVVQSRTASSNELTDIFKSNPWLIFFISITLLNAEDYVYITTPVKGIK